MRKLLVICGPTATGKTKLAVGLAKKFNGELVSADSRQIYRGLDIGTGKDFDQLKGVRVWGYDLVGPREEFSVAEYIKFARKIISDIHKRNKLSILVGGTGFYVKGVVDGIETSKVSRDKMLRKSLENKSASELFIMLTQLDPIKAVSLNVSDKKNPRRLIRAIEITKSKSENESIHRYTGKKYKSLFIGLRLDKKAQEERINKRVWQRMRMGIKQEIENLLKSGVNWSDQSMTSLGYRQWRSYFEDQITQERVVENWIKAEQQYAKRQMTWFRHDKRINWFNIADNLWEKQVEELVDKWYSLNKRK